MADMTHEDIERIWNSFSHYIPDRQKEGYGPSNKSFENLINFGVKLARRLSRNLPLNLPDSHS